MLKVIIFLYGLLIFLGTSMEFFSGKGFSTGVAALMGIVMMATVFFLSQKRKAAHYIILAFSLSLAVLLGYNFYQTTAFFDGLMSGSGFVIALTQVYALINY